ncbi:zinc-finger domain-containing protein [Coxiella-like endosymbiont of Amblyomma americanum]|uniref:zinc-finger domain-containing protein n=1 Tax=Coxiella-like endosymbiont of Amblyomma americanum TaxID=1987500 RepID=UPI000F89DB3E|nr:zinc-finger domain-containing protein [Coxiella-like endosymbiont of Amblyomma americanum]AUJ58588.1 hypothetical protein B1F76_00455 [Coxiella-like endosymbiont of Amblyomma americanum]
MKPNTNKTNLLQKYYKITQSDLPLSCPMMGKNIWNKHPKIYLPIEQRGYFVCPYCGTEYFLQGLERLKKECD